MGHHVALADGAKCMERVLKYKGGLCHGLAPTFRCRRRDDDGLRARYLGLGTSDPGGHRDNSKCMEEVAPGHHGHSINPRPTFLMPPLSFNCVNNWSKMPLMNPWLLGVL